MKIDVAQRKLKELLNDEKKLVTNLQIAPNLETKKQVLQNYENRVTRLIMNIENQKSDPEFNKVYKELLHLESWLKELMKKGIYLNIQEMGAGRVSNYWKNID